VKPKKGEVMAALDTEDLRKAMLYDRSLFDDLLQTASADERREVA